MSANDQRGEHYDLLCTQRELDEMCRTGLELVQEAIDTGDPRVAAEMATKVQTARGGLGDIFKNWAAASLAYLHEQHGEEAMAAALDPEEWLALGMNTGATLEDVQLARSVFLDPALVGARIGELVGVGSGAEAKRYWDEVEQATLKLHDHRIDWASAVLSHVYRTYGSEGLAGALGHASAQPWWRDRMTLDLQNDPVSRVREWSFFLGVGNFGQISVTEAAECFVIHHQVCGSCARQELRNMHEPPWSLARVAEPEPTLNFGISDYTVYRTHLAAWHFVMPIREGLPPWPAIDCKGVPGRCWFTLYKDPADTPARYYEMAGFTKLERESV
jgi:hypothetical protein